MYTLPKGFFTVNNSYNHESKPGYWLSTVAHRYNLSYLGDIRKRIIALRTYPKK
jgi:hypothetical protein